MINGFYKIITTYLFSFFLNAENKWKKSACSQIFMFSEHNR